MIPITATRSVDLRRPAIALALALALASFFMGQEAILTPERTTNNAHNVVADAVAAAAAFL